MIKFLKRNLFIIISSLIFATALVAVFIVGVGNEVYVFGYKPFIVASGSMEPTIQTNALAIVKQQELSDAQIDQIAVFRTGDGSALAAHRIIAIGDGGQLTTKGDAASVADFGTIGADSYVGKITFFSNEVAEYITKVRNEPGGVVKYLVIPVVIIFAVTALIWYGLVQILRAIRGKSRKKKSDSKQESSTRDQDPDDVVSADREEAQKSSENPE